MKLAINLNEVQESKPVPAGRYSVTIASAEEGNSKNGSPQIKASIGIQGHDDAPNVTHFISLPSGGDDPNKAQVKALFLKRFLHAFKVPFTNDGFDIEDFFGRSADLEITLSEPDDNGNVYNRLQLPKLPDEGGVKAAPKPPKR